MGEVASYQLLHSYATYKDCSYNESACVLFVGYSLQS